MELDDDTIKEEVFNSDVIMLMTDMENTIDKIEVAGIIDTKRRSRYGRHQKVKESSDYFPTDLAKFMPKSSPTKFKKPIVTLTPIRFDVTPVTESTTDFTNVVKDDVATVENGTTDKESQDELAISRRVSDSDSACGSSIDDFEMENSEFKLGMLCWARVNLTESFWPCIVCEDPEKRIFMEMKKFKSKISARVHLRYFGDNGRRSWVFKTNIISFHGLVAFENEYKVLTKPSFWKHKKKQEKVIYFTKSIKPSWDAAVALAEKFLIVPIEERIDKFIQEEIINRTAEKVMLKRKRRLLSLNSANSLINVETSPMNETNLGETMMEKSEPYLKKRRLTETSSSIYHLAEFHLFRDSILSQVSTKRNKNKKDDILKLIQELWSCKFHQDDEKLIIKREKLTLQEIFLPDVGINFLTKGLSREFVCRVCHHPKNLYKCTDCNHHFHKICTSQNNLNDDNIVNNNDESFANNGDSEETLDFDKEENLEKIPKFKCDDCISKIKKCSVCNGTNDKLIRCCNPSCNEDYHFDCIKHLPHTRTSDKLFCPVHICHTCSAEDSRAKLERNMKLSKCVLCPSSYHIDVNCIPAGTQMLTQTQIICPKHSNEKEKKLNTGKTHYNVNWCFICSLGGSLICCDTCLSAFHLDCLKLQVPPADNESYMCDDCESGKLPLYNDIVWAKLGRYRLWPALVVPPPNIPESLMKKKKPSDQYCIRFFGTHDFGWITRSRCFLYQEDDFMKDRNAHESNSIDAKFLVAVKEAAEVFNILKIRKENKVDHFKVIRPTYKKLKTNRYLIPQISQISKNIKNDSICVCSPSDVDPCGYNSKCLNRIVMYECDPDTCPAGTSCQNQLFKYQKYPKIQEISLDNNRGFGLVTLEDLYAGQFVVEYVGEVIDQKEFQSRLDFKLKQKDENFYFLTLNYEYTIDAGPKGNIARFMNHSCEPNCETQKWMVNGQTRVGLFAITDIKANTELTFNYQWESVGNDKQKQKCYCGTPSCIGFIGGKKKPLLKNIIDKRTLSTTEKKKRKRGPNKPKILATILPNEALPQILVD